MFIAGDAGDGCYRVEEGLLKVSSLSPSGSERILAILGPGSIVGELSMIDGGPRSATVTAIRPSKVVFVSRVSFNAFVNERPEVHRHLTALLARRLRDIDDALTSSSFLSLRGRVARVLQNLAEGFGKDLGTGGILVHQKVSQSDIAAMAGIARENVSRILQDWLRQSVVTRISGYYCIKDRAALAKAAES